MRGQKKESIIKKRYTKEKGIPKKRYTKERDFFFPLYPVNLENKKKVIKKNFNVSDFWIGKCKFKNKKENACLFFSVSRKTFLVENRVDF